MTWASNASGVDGESSRKARRSQKAMTLYGLFAMPWFHELRISQLRPHFTAPRLPFIAMSFPSPSPHNELTGLFWAATRRLVLLALRYYTLDRPYLTTQRPGSLGDCFHCQHQSSKSRANARSNDCQPSSRHSQQSKEAFTYLASNP